MPPTVDELASYEVADDDGGWGDAAVQSERTARAHGFGEDRPHDRRDRVSPRVDVRRELPDRFAALPRRDVERVHPAREVRRRRGALDAAPAHSASLAREGREPTDGAPREL